MQMFSKSMLLISLVISPWLFGCAHSITINPIASPTQTEEIIPKKVGYVIIDADRLKKVVTPGGGGDDIQYFPYRDLENGLKDSLRSIYTDAYLLPSTAERKTINDKNISFIFSPEIVTTSSSSSLMTWPPTKFTVELSCNVTDNSGNMISRIRVIGSGQAEFSEFKSDYALAARRASADAFAKFVEEIKANPKLYRVNKSLK